MHMCETFMTTVYRRTNLCTAQLFFPDVFSDWSFVLKDHSFISLLLFTLMIFCSGMPNGEAICGNPVLRGITPLRCADHDPKSQKLIIEALKNAGIDLPLTSKSVPKLSLLISETVREIQMKRKFSMNAGKTAPSDMSLKWFVWISLWSLCTWWPYRDGDVPL